MQGRPAGEGGVWAGSVGVFGPGLCGQSVPVLPVQGSVWVGAEGWGWVCGWLCGAHGAGGAS